MKIFGSVGHQIPIKNKKNKKVLYNCKQRNNKNIFVVNGGINLVSSLNTWYHPMELMHSATLETSRDSLNNDWTYIVYGSNCFESDIFTKKLTVPQEVQLGDFFIIGSAGGYDLPSANVWTRPSPAIYGIYKDKLITLRRAQTTQEIRQCHFNLQEQDYVSDSH